MGQFENHGRSRVVFCLESGIDKKPNAGSTKNVTQSRFDVNKVESIRRENRRKNVSILRQQCDITQGISNSM